MESTAGCNSQSFRQLETDVPVESSDGSVLRSDRLMMAFKLLAMAQQRWRKLNGAHLLPLVRAGVAFEDGKPVERNDNDHQEAA